MSTPSRLPMDLDYGDDSDTETDEPEEKKRDTVRASDLHRGPSIRATSSSSSSSSRNLSQAIDIPPTLKWRKGVAFLGGVWKTKVYWICVEYNSERIVYELLGEELYTPYQCTLEFKFFDKRYVSKVLGQSQHLPDDIVQYTMGFLPKKEKWEAKGLLLAGSEAPFDGGYWTHEPGGIKDHNGIKAPLMMMTAEKELTRKFQKNPLSELRPNTRSPSASLLFTKPSNPDPRLKSPQPLDIAKVDRWGHRGEILDLYIGDPRSPEALVIMLDAPFTGTRGPSSSSSSSSSSSYKDPKNQNPKRQKTGARFAWFSGDTERDKLGRLVIQSHQPILAFWKRTTRCGQKCVQYTWTNALFPQWCTIQCITSDNNDEPCAWTASGSLARDQTVPQQAMTIPVQVERGLLSRKALSSASQTERGDYEEMLSERKEYKDRNPRDQLEFMRAERSLCVQVHKWNKDDKYCDLVITDPRSPSTILIVNGIIQDGSPQDPQLKTSGKALVPCSKGHRAKLNTSANACFRIWHRYRR